MKTLDSGKERNPPRSNCWYVSRIKVVKRWTRSGYKVKIWQRGFWSGGHTCAAMEYECGRDLGTFTAEEGLAIYNYVWNDPETKSFIQWINSTYDRKISLGIY